MPPGQSRWRRLLHTSSEILANHLAFSNLSFPTCKGSGNPSPLRVGKGAKDHMTSRHKGQEPGISNFLVSYLCRARAEESKHFKSKALRKILNKAP